VDAKGSKSLERVFLYGPPSREVVQEEAVGNFSSSLRNRVRDGRSTIVAQ
jgi:hypothetical protein